MFATSLASKIRKEPNKIAKVIIDDIKSKIDGVDIDMISATSASLTINPTKKIELLLETLEKMMRDYIKVFSTNSLSFGYDLEYDYDRIYLKFSVALE